MKMRLKMKNRSHRYDINRPRPIYGHKYTKYKMCFSIPAGNCMFKVNNRNTRTRCEICSKLTIKTPERRHLHRSGVFIVNFEHISHLVLVFLLLT